MVTTCETLWTFGGFVYQCTQHLVSQVPWQFWYNLGPHWGQFGWY